MSVSKKQRGRKRKSDLQLIYDRKDEYNHLISIGYTQEQAIKKLRNMAPLSSLQKLELRYKNNFKSFGTSGISMKGIHRTKEVEKFINTHHLIDRGDTLYFPANKKMTRTSPVSITGKTQYTSKREKSIPYDLSSGSRPQFVGGRLTIPKSVMEEAEGRKQERLKIKRQEGARKALTTRQRNFEERQRALDDMPFPEKFYIETDDDKTADKIIDYVKRHPGIDMKGIAGGAEAGRAIWYPATDRTIRMEFIADRKGLDDLIDFLHKFKGKIKYDAGF